MTRLIFNILVVILVFGCSNKTSRVSLNKNKPQTSTDAFGDRWCITGDFNGDGQQETLQESFVSSIDGKEINKKYNADYDSMVSLTIKQKPICRLLSNKIKPLTINKNNWQIFGLAYLKNEGDLDGNGTDEVGLIIDWADWSNVNYYHVFT